MKIGAITVGQAPRVDVTADIMDIFEEGTELLQRGGLDGLTRQEIEAFAPREGDYVLVSRLTDGSHVTFAERCILDRLQKGIEELEEAGVAMILVFCTGHFPENLKAHVPMIFPEELLTRIVPLMTAKSSICTVTPSPLQLEQNRAKWSAYVKSVTNLAANPYGDMASIRAAAEACAVMEDVDLIVLDCIGFTREMKNMFSEITGKRVILPRTLLARVISEVTNH